MEREDFACMEMGCVNVTGGRFGNKAYALERMYEEGINVPWAFYLNSEFLNRIFMDGYRKEYKKLAERLNAYNRNTGIRQWIQGQKQNDELFRLCAEICHRFQGKIIAVRSSANVEDGTSKSYAGVIFTANPLTGAEEYVINYTDGTCEGVVSGKDVKEAIFDKTEEKEIDGFSREIIGQLINAAEKIEVLFGKAMDIEWAVNGNRVFILQARPITTIKKRTVVHQNLYIDSLSEKIAEYDMNAIRRAHKKYMEKHYYVRKKAREAGLLFPETGYLFYNKNTLSEEIFSRITFDARIYKVVSDREIRTLARENVVDYLKTCTETEDHIVRLQQITMTEACGNTSLTEDGHVYIEFLPGGFGWFLSGELPFSVYLADREGNIQYRDEKVYSAKWEFDEEKKQFFKKPCQSFSYSLSEKVILQLVHMAVKMRQIMPNARAEWEMEGEAVYLNDISFEGSGVRSQELIHRQISAGNMSGEIRVIQDMEELRKILKGRSIIPESEFYEAARSDALQEYLQKHTIDRAKRYIFVTESAHPTLSLLLPYASGFVFEKGGMLSHMAIILRENHIPGIIEANAVKKYHDGEIYGEGDIQDFNTEERIEGD